MLIDLLHTCTDLLQKAERYELLAAVYNMVIPHFERKRDYEVGTTTLNICCIIEVSRLFAIYAILLFLTFQASLLRV